MKKHIFTLALLFTAFGLRAQSIKHISNFSFYQQYYNPAFTGFEGSAVKSFYRNQWTGFEDAPKTIFLSGELDLTDMASHKRTNAAERFATYGGAAHAFGLAVLQDEFGPSKETQVFLSYGSRVRLSNGLRLRWGAAVTYNSFGIDGNKLIVDQENDPKYTSVQGQQNRVGKMDFNLGLALTSEHVYLGYAMQDITKEGVLNTGDDFLRSFYTRKSIVQAGYRTSLSDELGVVANAIYQHDSDLEDTVEGQLKFVYQNMFWAGGGYRHNLAYNVVAGIRLNQLRLNYAYESPVQNASSINKNTNEISVIYTFRPEQGSRNGRYSLSVW